MSTSTSLRLLLEDFLGLMREEGELDVFLSLLLSAMGHEIVYRPKKGVKEYGVDIASIGPDEEDGRRKLFLWVIKQGAIGRTEWNGTQQSISYSLDELVMVYVESHVNPQHAKLPIKAVVLTNGDFHRTLNHAIATTFKKLSRLHSIEFETANGSKLASWSENYLLDEYLLPKDIRVLLRRMLANIGMPELSLRSGRKLVLQLVELAAQEGGTAQAKKKRQLVALRGVRTALSLARIYGLSEDNLTAAYKLAEFSVISSWARLHSMLLTAPHISDELNALRKQWTDIAFDYHQRMFPYYRTQDAFASAFPDSLLVAERAFEELGLLALQANHWGSLGAQFGEPMCVEYTGWYVDQVKALLDTHDCTSFPPYDRHATVIHATLCALMTAQERAIAELWLKTLVHRSAHAARNIQHWPLSCGFEDALAIRNGEQNGVEEATNVTTVIPVLLTWAAALEREDLYALLMEKVVPAIPTWCTLSMWSSDVGFDSVLGDEAALSEHGVSEGLLFVPPTGEQFNLRMCVALNDIEPIEQSTWYARREPFIPMLAALHWGLQLPRTMMVRQAVALSTKP